MNVAGLYALLSPEALPLEGFPAAAKQLAAHGVRQIQIRLKAATDAQRLEVQRAVARALGEVADWGGVLVVNDRADLAYVLAIEAPELRVGLHLGQDDLSPVLARAVVGPDVVLGLSTHDLEQVRAARGLPLDYIAFGPIYHTATKANPSPIVGVEGLRAACRYADLPVVAIGGITADRARAVYRAGAASIAVASGLFGGGDAELAARVAAYRVAEGQGG